MIATEALHVEIMLDDKILTATEDVLVQEASNTAFIQTYKSVAMPRSRCLPITVIETSIA